MSPRISCTPIAPPSTKRVGAAGSDAPGYPYTAGTAQLREAAARWLARRTGAEGVDPSTVLSSPGFFSSKYVKRFWDEHASVCKVVGYECERQQMLAFDQNQSE